MKCTSSESVWDLWTLADLCLTQGNYLNRSHYQDKHGTILFCTVTESVTLFPLEFFKCCCLPSLQTTFSSLSFTEKVSRLAYKLSTQLPAFFFFF